jgi:hypothetical protein
MQKPYNYENSKGGKKLQNQMEFGKITLITTSINIKEDDLVMMKGCQAPMQIWKS